MSGNSSYYYLNLANEWPTFTFPPSVNVDEQESPGAILVEPSESEPVTIIGGAYEFSVQKVKWIRIRLNADIPPGTSVQLYYARSEIAPPSTFNSHATQLDFPWQATAQNTLDHLIENISATPLWLACVLKNSEGKSPAIHQIRLDFGEQSYLDRLPSIYRSPAQEKTLRPLLDLLKIDLENYDNLINALPSLFDAEASPDSLDNSWLSWLAGWLDFELVKSWTEDQKRVYLSQAYTLYRQRGTHSGLKKILKIYANVEATIEEPGASTQIWMLGEYSQLGASTKLAPAHMQAATLGNTATLDNAYLNNEVSTSDIELGQNLFREHAHSFYVHIHEAELTYPEKLDEIKDIIAREKPAHTHARLNIIKPTLKIGLQSRIGVDAIVAKGPASMVLGETFGLLSEDSLPCRGQPNLPDDIKVCENDEEQELS